MGRIEELCALCEISESFADVGCDHGYIARHVLKSGKCANVLVTDVSEKCLAKAERLLAEYIKAGKCRAVCCDGLALVPEDTAQVIIAGMGGEEIIKILSEGFIPRKFILQPMKNADKVRKFLLESGCKITYDGIFRDEKFYFVIKGERSGGTEKYTPAGLAFGKDSLHTETLKEFAAAELKKSEAHLARCERAARRKEIEEQIKLLKEALL